MTILWLLVACVAVGLLLGLVGGETPLEIAAKVGLMGGVALLFVYLVSLLDAPGH